MAVIARLTPGFLETLSRTRLTDEAAARAIGVPLADYAAIKSGSASPTTKFIVGAIRAGLASTFSEVAEPAQPIAA